MPALSMSAMGGKTDTQHPRSRVWLMAKGIAVEAVCGEHSALYVSLIRGLQAPVQALNVRIEANRFPLSKRWRRCRFEFSLAEADIADVDGDHQHFADR